MWLQPEAPRPGECGMRSQFVGTKVGKSVCGGPVYDEGGICVRMSWDLPLVQQQGA